METNNYLVGQVVFGSCSPSIETSSSSSSLSYILIYDVALFSLYYIIVVVVVLHTYKTQAAKGSGFKERGKRQMTSSSIETKFVLYVGFAAAAVTSGW